MSYKINVDSLTMYHGTCVPLVLLTNNKGDIVLKPSKNFDGKTTSISFTHSKDTATRYAAKIKAGGPFGYDFSKAYVIKINPGAIKELRRENEEEWAVNTNKPITLHKKTFKIVPHRLSQRINDIESEYSIHEFICDNYDEFEREELTESKRIESYIDHHIAEDDEALADEMYKEMEYLSKGDYPDLALNKRTYLYHVVYPLVQDTRMIILYTEALQNFLLAAGVKIKREAGKGSYIEV